MKTDQIERAASLFVGVREERIPPLDALPEECAPHDVQAAQAIQDKTMEMLGETVGALKVGQDGEGTLLRGLIFGSRVFESPVTIPADMTRLRGVEAEIAFRFETELPHRVEPYTPEEVAAAVQALVVIEIVDSRFEDIDATPFYDKAADFLSNGGLVISEPRADWQSFDLSTLEVVLTASGRTVKRGVGGHPAGDPILPAVAYVNAVTRTAAVPKGLIITTGSFTGMDFMEPGDAVKAEFVGFGTAEVTFE